MTLAIGREDVEASVRRARAAGEEPDLCGLGLRGVDLAGFDLEEVCLIERTCATPISAARSSAARI